MLLEIGIGDLNRPCHGGRYPVREPAPKRIVDNEQRESRGDHRRQRRHTAEQQGKAPVKLISRHLLPPFDPEPQDLPDDEPADDHHRDQIDHDQGGERAAVGADRVELRQLIDRHDADPERHENG